LQPVTHLTERLRGVPDFDPAPPSVFSAFASSVDRLASERAGEEDLGSLHAVLDSVLARAARELPSRDPADDSARRRADAALARLDRRSRRSTSS
jgi:hypothetical protein